MVETAGDAVGDAGVGGHGCDGGWCVRLRAGWVCVTVGGWMGVSGEWREVKLSVIIGGDGCAR